MINWLARGVSDFPLIIEIHLKMSLNELHFIVNYSDRLYGEFSHFRQLKKAI